MVVGRKVGRQPTGRKSGQVIKWEVLFTGKTHGKKAP